jgi:hypothetical protein
MKPLGRLQKVELRETWKLETEFSSWLAQSENLKLLGDAIGIELDLDSQEKEVGPFRCDIVCKEAEGRVVIIENQIEDTNHNHLGQLLTYAAGLDAVIVVWIAQEFTEEHRAALDWLNEKANNSVSFFGVEIEIWKIGDSPPAPKFNIVAKPNKWSNTVKQSVRNDDLTDTQKLRIEYWTALISFLKSSGSFLQCNKPSPHSYLRAKNSSPGLRCGFEISPMYQRIDVYFGSWNEEKVERFRKLYQEHKTQIENELQEKIEWSDNEEGGKFWVSAYLETNPSNKNDWPRQHEWLKQVFERMTNVILKYLAV